MDNFPIISLPAKREGREPSLLWSRHCPEILYPPIDKSVFELPKEFSQTFSDLVGREVADNQIVLTSLNRYERKKGIQLAIGALKEFQSGANRDAILIIAGGWDPRVAENVEHEQELRKAAKEAGVEDKVIFLKSISNEQRILLLNRTDALLYTPQNEHFGIVPVEAMYKECIVLACNSGGPLESILHGESGFLEEPDAKKWGKRLQGIFSEDAATLRSKIKAGAHKRA